MGFHDIEKKSIWYSFLLHIVVIPWHNIIFYRKIFINFRERIPKNDHVIFAPNHQNALLDALALLCNIDRQLVFLARSDIFKKKKIAGILYFLKILPVFRKRDGLRSVKNNMETFDKTAEVIQAKNGLVILPEGDFVRKHQLRPLKKGFARIAFQAGEANDFGLDIKIVPVGLHYSSFSELRCDLIINFGHPVAVSKYYDLYKSAPAVAINKLTNALKDALRQVMLELPDQDYEMFYDLIQISRARLDQLKIKPANDLKTEQETTSKLIRLQANDPAGYTLLKNAFQKFCNQLNLTSVNKETFIKSKAEPLILSLKSLGLLLGIPFYLYAVINNMVPFLITGGFVRMIKDVAFRNSFRFVISLLVFPTLYIIQFILVFVFTAWWFAILYLAVLPFSWIFTVSFSRISIHTVHEWELLFLKITNPSVYKNLYKAYNEVINLMEVK